MVTASLKNYRQSPRKVRLVADLIRGKSVNHALTTLEHLPKRATDALSALLNSAVANAKNNFSLEKENLFVKEIRVDAGQVLKRRMPRAQGSAFPINKRTSHVRLVLGEKVESAVKKGKKTKASKKTK
jgi:large subunit ribosomal protein L22